MTADTTMEEVARRVKILLNPHATIGQGCRQETSDMLVKLAAERDAAVARAEAAEAIINEAADKKSPILRTRDGKLVIFADGPVPDLWHGSSKLMQDEWDVSIQHDIDVVSSGYSTREAALAAREAKP